MKKVLLIGNGAREHAIAEALKKSKYGVSLFTYAKAKNPGIFELSDGGYEIGDVLDIANILEFAQNISPDFAIIGPEDPIAAGVADELAKINVPCVAPNKYAAQIEASKSFTRDLMQEYEIAGNPEYKVFTSPEGIKEMLEKLGGNFVIKADGLMAGKGVKVSGDHLKSVEEGVIYATECIRKAGRVVIEEKLIGQEFSLMSFTDGKTLANMPAVQDHKRAFDSDLGPNTGGMGTYSDANHSLPFLTENDIQQASEVNKKIIQAVYKKSSQYFKGIIYGGYMATKTGVRLIEFNVRFGDPETMNVLPILKTDFVDVCEAIINGTLDQLKIEFENKATVCKYVVPNGYPDSPVKGEKIEIGNVPEGVNVYYASINQTENGLVLGGSRAVAFVGIGNTIGEAAELASSGLLSVKGPVFYRKDIGTKELIEKRVRMMKEIRG